MASAASRLLTAADVAHCVVDGDNLCATYPAPAGDPTRVGLTETNLSQLWRSYAAAGYRRLIYVNTVCVINNDWLLRAVAPVDSVVGVLLRCRQETAASRLAGREHGVSLAEHLSRSGFAATTLDQSAMPGVARVDTDGRTVDEVAAEVLTRTGWTDGGDPADVRRSGDVVLRRAGP
ncbi:MAG: ATPase [Mycobacteriales bacterium]